MLMEKALRLAQRHARHSNKPRLHCFFLGSLSVDAGQSSPEHRLVQLHSVHSY